MTSTAILEMPFCYSALHTGCRKSKMLESQRSTDAPVSSLAIADDFSVPMLVELGRSACKFVQRNMMCTFDMPLPPLLFRPNVEKKYASIRLDSLRHFPHTVVSDGSVHEKPT